MSTDYSSHLTCSLGVASPAVSQDCIAVFEFYMVIYLFIVYLVLPKPAELFECVPYVLLIFVSWGLK